MVTNILPDQKCWQHSSKEITKPMLPILLVNQSYVMCGKITFINHYTINGNIVITTESNTTLPVKGLRPIFDLLSMVDVITAKLEDAHSSLQH